MLFISYSRRDRAIAQKLHQCMLDHGYQSHQVFKDDDPRNGLVIGKQWEQQLIQNLQGCRGLIVIVTPDWLKSKWCFAELAFTKSNPFNPAVIPFVVRELSAKQWAKSGLEPFQRPRDMHSGLSDLSGALNQFVETELLPKYPPDHPNQRRREAHPFASLFHAKSFDAWALDPDMQSRLVVGADQQAMMEELDQLLNQPTAAQHIHVIGESGSGKTRLVHEVLKNPRLSELVLYYDAPSTLWSDPYFRELTSINSDQSAIVVVDDCLRGEYATISRQVNKSGNRVRLVTISYVRGVGLAPTWYQLEVQPLKPDSMAAIISSYIHPTADVSAFVELCNGSPRFAHLVGESLRRQTSILEPPNQQTIIERIIACGEEIHDAQAINRLVVARFLSIFDRFGFAPPHSDEVRSIASLVNQFHPSIGLGDVLDTIKTLREHRILQGRSTLYFSTALLSMQLWQQWWALYGSQIRLAQIKELPEYLQKGLAAMLRRVPESDSIRLIADVIRHDPDFSEPAMMLEGYDGARAILYALSDICPTQVTEVLWRCWNRWDGETPSPHEFYRHLSGFSHALHVAAIRRRESLAEIRLLEEMAKNNLVERGLEHGRHLESEYLGRIFSVSNGEALNKFPYAEYLTHLRLLIEERGTVSELVAVDICKHAIAHSRDASPQTIRYVNDLWRLLNDAAKNCFDANRQASFVESVSDCLGILFTHPSAVPARLETLQWLVDAPPLLRVYIMASIERYSIHSHFQNPEVLVPLAAFYRRLIGSDLRDRLFTILSAFDRSADETDRQELIDFDLELRHLAEELVAVGDQSLFELLTNSIHTVSLKTLGRRLAEQSGAETTREMAIQAVADAGENANTLLLAGYLEQLRERDPDQHDTTLELLCHNVPSQNVTLCLLVQSQGPSEKKNTLISHLIVDKGADATILRRLGSQWLKTFDRDHVLLWVRSCLDRHDLQGLDAACRILKEFRPDLDFDPDTTQVIKEIISSPLAFKQCDTSNGIHTYGHHLWLRLFEWLMPVDPTTCLKVAGNLWQQIRGGEPGLSVGRKTSAAENAAELLIAADVPHVWETFFEVLRASDRKAARNLFYWLSRVNDDSEGKGAYWRKVPDRMLCEWVDLDPINRIREVCHFLPQLVAADGIVAPTREFLLRYWDQDTACWEMISCAQPSSWSGELSDYHQARIGWIVEAQAHESNPVVAEWLQTMLMAHVKELERARESEEIQTEREPW